eukprot:scaffold89029_cov21-Tisochrysis_lutea.AAC.1
MAAMVALMQQYMATAAATNNAGVPVRERTKQFEVGWRVAVSCFQDLARRADGALLAIGVMGDILKEKSHGAVWDLHHHDFHTLIHFATLSCGAQTDSTQKGVSKAAATLYIRQPMRTGLANVWGQRRAPN